MKKPVPILPNEISGVVVETREEPFAFTSRKTMTVRFSNGTEGVFPMIVVAKPCDRFIFTIRPV